MKRLLLLLLAAALPAAAPAQQRQYIDVGSPDFRPLPLAVPDFRADPGAEADAREMAGVLRRDLALTGLFDLLDPRSFLASPDEGVTAPLIRFSRWADVGAEGLVKAQVRKGAELTADFHLFEVRAGREVLAFASRGPPGSARPQAHRLADEVVRYYTREPGIFRTRIAVFRVLKGGRELVLYDADGGAPEVVWRDQVALLPAWRPDGKAILFTSYRGGRPELWELTLATRQARRLISLGALATGGSYSPDGKRIAFAASVHGNSDVYLCNADGSGVRRLTDDPATDGSPNWSPDGKRIAFNSDRTGRPQIFVMNADGSEQRRITFQGENNTTPRWSPRGDVIAYTARDERLVFDLFTISPDTGQTRRLTQDAGPKNEEPTWAPTGRLLAFTRDLGRGPQLVLTDAKGERLYPVPGADVSTPAWGPLPRE